MSVSVFISIVGDIAGIQVDLFDFVVLRSLRGRRRAFGFSLFDGRLPARVLTRRSFLGGSRPVERGRKVANIFLNSSSAAVVAGALAADMSDAGVWRSVPLLPLRGVCTLSASSVDMSG
ncbi:hypothetical protein F2Q70_00036879 [Brassica cretica]|uniref:Uncharacterized protein n=1 Tax=Brassica cretica TaxID=69181 RepID=A0A8S9JRQ8_BRACR|nr:hypothetical protein F2Q70_00036879 [Brassica cretica]